ncbi:unnamed protein product, partial [Symbiodinium sp. KB8]
VCPSWTPPICKRWLQFSVEMSSPRLSWSWNRGVCGEAHRFGRARVQQEIELCSGSRRRDVL